MVVRFNPYSGLSFGVKNKYGWKKPEQSIAYRRNSKDGYVVPNNSLNGFPPAKKAQIDCAESASEFVLLCRTPNELADCIKELNQTVIASEDNGLYGGEKVEAARDIVEDVTSFLDCKIDFDRLGIDPDYLSDDEMIEYGSKFLFWTTSLDGSKRNGIERPGFVRSAKEYMALVEELHPLDAASEFEGIMARLPESILLKDKRIQDNYNSEYRSQMQGYNRISGMKKFSVQRPVLKFSPIYGELKRLQELRRQTIDNLNNANARKKELDYRHKLANAFMDCN